MKKIIVFAFVFINVFFNAQFSDCNISTNELKYNYYQLKNLGIDYKFPKGQEVVPNIVDIIGANGLKQLCIDAAYLNNQVGTENQFIYYKNNIKNISRESFFENYQYLMLFDEIVKSVEKTTSFRRPVKNEYSKESNTYSNSKNFYSGREYRVNANKNHKVYFYSRPDLNFRKKSNFTTSEYVFIKALDNGFADVDFTNSRGQKSSGWIKTSDLIN